MKIPKYYRSEKAFKRIHKTIKNWLCPNCKQYSFLILNGYLYGNAEDNSQKKVVRGHRIFCSNRRKRGGNGCGGSVVIMAADIIKSFSITTKSLWCFLENLKKGASRLRAFSHSNITPSSVYRIYQRFKENQSYIRTILLSLGKPPNLKNIQDPVIETIVHIEFALKSGPLTRFQAYFQASIL